MPPNATILIQALQNPNLYPHPIEYFKIIETHISWVLLTGAYAYKIKKPLNLGFLDFSTLEKRRHCCYEELRLNSRLSKDLYLAVIALGGTAEHPILNAHDAIIEYAVQMRQFEYDKTFDQLLAQDKLTSTHIKQTAFTIATFHNSITSVAVNSEFGSSHAVLQPVMENFTQIQALAKLQKPEYLAHLESWSRQQHTELTTFFDQRKQQGFIRACHGDLHLGNIALIDGQIVPFDGIEFNPDLNSIDLVNDIAFLIMDLQSKNQQGLAYQLINAYLEYTGDYTGLKALRFYLVYRAIVMAKVNAIRAMQRDTDHQQQLDMAKFNTYLQLAHTYIQLPSPQLIIMHGVSGSGKSWLSEQIIQHYPIIRIRSDIERKRLFEQQRHNSKNALYSATYSELTYQHLLKLAGEILNNGYSVIVDATFLHRQQREPFAALASSKQTPFLLIHTHADKSTLLTRIKQRTRQQDNVSDADQAVLAKQLIHQHPLNETELKHSFSLNTQYPEQINLLWTLLNTLLKCNLN